MSLTYPILNDILADKANTLSQDLNQLCKELNEHILMTSINLKCNQMI